ncbi:unnamed protein product [Paramecium octaurelia]|uniref:MIR domain-containing protein n=1 Tax=Paramecium octaurelia TaxID=43137 RepID=A0A8S1Y9E8_PAROT|nr:unnamed protein product [Paramecium octaurelia]
MSQPLRYGQIISLKPSEMDHMFVISDGHIKTKAQIFEIKAKKVASGTLFFQSLFQIYPQFQTSKIDQALKLERELQKEKYQKDNMKSNKIKEMEEKVFQEYKQNIETAEKNKDQIFTMAQPIQFLHLSSNKFLACNYFEADEEKENFKLELNEYPSDNTCFRLVPAYFHQTRADGLIADEPLYIIMDKIYLGMKPYLHMSESTKRYNNHLILASRTMFNFPNAKALQRKIISGQTKSKQSRVDLNDLQEPNTQIMLMALDYKKKQDLELAHQLASAESIQKKEINVSLEKRSPFLISVFSNTEEDENKIYFGDVIWLHHIELNAILVTVKNMSDEIIVSLQQTKNDQLGEFIGNTNGMWYIESLNMKGGPVEWGQIFRLRHFSLGKYLAVQKEQDRDTDTYSCFYLEDKQSENSLLQFSALPSSINENEKFVTKDGFFKLKNNKKWIQFIDKHPDSDSSIVMLRLSDNCKDDDVLKCYKANLNEIQETSFLVSCFPIMRKTLSILTDLATKDYKKIYQDKNIKFPKKIAQLKKVLQDLTRFCSNQFLISSQNRQKVLKEQYFIDILLEILCNISNEGEIKEYLELTRKRKGHGFSDTLQRSAAQKLHSAAFQVRDGLLQDFGQVASRVQQENDKKQLRQYIGEKFEVIKMIYQLLICICKDNNQNEEYVYNRVEKFQYQAKFFKETTDFIISLLKNNEYLLQNLTEKIRFSGQNQRRDRHESIKSYPQSRLDISQLQRDPNNIVLFYKKLVEESQNSKDYIEFFRTICKYNNKGLSVNQETIFKKCQENPKFNNALFWTITCTDNQMLIEKDVDKKTMFQLNKEELDSFVAQLRLYSDLALSRNFQWKGILEKKFPKQFTFEQIFNNELDPDVRSALCNLALTVYIDHEPLHLQIVPNLCRLVNQQAIKQQQEFHDHEIFKQLIPKVMTQIHDYKKNLIDELTKGSQASKKIKSEAQLQLDIIKLAKTLIQFDVVNLINRKDIYSEILQPLITFLEYDKNNYVLSYLMNLQREETLKRAKNSNKIISTMKGMVTGAIDVGRALVNVVVRKKQDLEEEFAEQTLFSKHPITASLLTITSKIQSLNTEKGEETYQIDIEQKMEVCELLIFFQEMRLDFLITNFLAFYAAKQKKKSNKLKYELEFDLLQVLPPTLRTGIEEPTKQGAKNIIQWLGDIISRMGRFLNKKFTNFTKEQEMPDLDTLMSGANKDLVKEAVLPSLLIVFHVSSDCLLLDKVVEVIRRCFSQKLELFKKMRDLEILFDQTEINCYQKMVQLLSRLRTLTESSEVWINSFHNKSTEKEASNEPKELHQVQHITKDLDSLLYKHTTVTPNLEIITQDDFLQISTSRQKVFNFLNGHTPLINFLRDSQNQLCDFLKGEYKSDYQQTVSELLKTIYQCLTNFCKGNRPNQNLLAQHFELFVDKIEIDFGQTTLLCAIYEDNKFLCENIPDSRIKQFLTNIRDFGRQSRFLELLKTIQICKGQSLVENQLKILSFLLPHQKEENKKAHEYLLWGQFTKDSKGIEFNFFNDGQDKDYKHQPYKYHCKLIDLLLQTTQGEESYKLNTPKLKQIFSLGYLVNLVAEENDEFIEGYYPNGTKDANQLKVKVILFINWIYIQNSLTQQEVMIKEQANFNKLFNKEKERLLKLSSYPNRDEYLKYFFDHLVPLFENFVNKIYAQEKAQRDDNYDVLKEILETIAMMSDGILCQYLTKNQYNALYRLYKPFEENTNRLQMNFSSAIKDQNDGLSSNKKSVYEPPPPEFMKSSLKKNQVMTIFNKKEKSFLTEQFKTPNSNDKSKMSRNKFSQTSQQLWVNRPNWFQFLDMCEQSQVLQDKIKEELHTLASAIFHIDKLVSDKMNTSQSNSVNLDFKGFLKKYIRFVEQGIINKAGKKNLIYSLQLLEELLTINDLEEMQNLFDQQNATRMILNIIADYKIYPFDDDFFNQLLSFGCKLLEGGNPKVQKTIFNYFSTYSRSENIFSKLNMVINDHIEELNIKYKIQNEMQKEEKQQQILQLDTEPQVPQDQVNDHTQEMQFKQKLRESLLINVLRFVQLFCEGHNLDLQNYIRQQFNSRNNYNLVSSIIELLYMYHLELTNENYENILRCLDTLTEFVQGPCCQNQQTIIDSKFLEVANSLLATQASKTKSKEHSSKSFFSQDEQSNQKNSSSNLSVGKIKSGKSFKNNRINIKKYMLERIKYKVMVLVTSLLELNSDSLAIKRIMRSLPIEILKKNLTQIYKKHKKLYGPTYTQDALKHIDEDPEGNTEKPEFHEAILETGFYIYFLILYYYELDTQEIDQETSTELQKAKNSLFNKNLFMDSLIGQLFTFAFAIIGGVLTTISQAKNYLQKAVERIGQKIDSTEIDKKNQKQKEINQEIFRETIQFFAYNSAHVEVVRNNQIERIQFYKPPYCKYLPKERKKEFHETVNRDSTNSKISDLIEQTDSIIEVCKHEEKLAVFFSKNKFIAIFANYVILWKDLAFILTLLLNLFIILSYADNEKTGQQTGDEVESIQTIRKNRISNPILLNSNLTVDETESLFFICGIIMIVCSTFVVLFFLLKKAPLYIKESYKKQDLSEYGVLINSLFQIFNFSYSIARVLLNIEILYYLSYGTLAFLATFYHPFFFAFHLTEIVIRFPQLRNIIKSFWEPKLSLLLTFILIILFNYFFTLFAYIFFYDDYSGKCESLLYCFLETFDKAFKNNGGIGGWLDSNQPQDPGDYNYGRFFFDNLYNIVIVIIMIQIFSGIIIDTFSSLREKQMQRDQDIQETCFICGFSRELFDRKSEAGFKLHTQYEHYMWNYVFYISYLKEKEPTEYTGIESYIANKLKNYDNSWIPINKAMVLKNMVLESQHYETEKLQDIQREMDYIKKTSFEIYKEMEELNIQFLNKQLLNQEK